MEPQKMVNSARPGRPGKLQITREISVAAEVRERGHGSRGDDHQPDRQAVEAVGEIHGIGRTHQDQNQKAEEKGRTQTDTSTDCAASDRISRSGLKFLKNGTFMFVEYSSARIHPQQQ